MMLVRCLRLERGRRSTLIMLWSSSAQLIACLTTVRDTPARAPLARGEVRCEVWRQRPCRRMLTSAQKRSPPVRRALLWRPLDGVAPR